MEIEPYYWLIAFVILLLIEVVTMGLTTIWFAGGALVAAVASYFGAGLITQLMLFLCVSLVLLIFTRPAAVKFMNKGVTKTNAESLIGRKAVVIKTIDTLAQTGQVRISDIEWMARTASDGIVIPENAVVMVKEIQGVKLIVEEVQEG